LPSPPPANAGQRGGIPPSEPAIAPVTTDRDGTFVFPALPVGSYRINIQKDGYVRQDYGQHVFPGQGAMLKVAAGDNLKGLTVRMIPTGAINGRVTYGDGQPAAGVSLQLIHVAYNAAGQRIQQISSRAASNDRGEYRIYWITPGTYYMSAGTPLGSTVPIQPDWSPFLYYPGTTDIDRAVPITIKAGSEGSVDMVVERQHPYHIRGKIVDGASHSPSAVGLQLVFPTFGATAGFMGYNAAYDPTTGSFDISDLPPGNYIIQANSGAGIARLPVQVTNFDVENATVVIGSPIPIAGEVRVDGGGALPSAETRIQLRPIVPGVRTFVGFTPSAQSGADGTFKVDNVLSGEYRAVITPPNGYYVREAKFEGRDALSRTIEISHDAKFEIVVSPNVAQISGNVVDERGRPAQSARVVLVPDQDRDRTELFISVPADQDGVFSMPRVTPGNYRLFAWEAIETNGFFNPDILKKDEALSLPVRVEESAKLNLQSKVIPADTK
jgi:hypothetical protein